MTAAEWGTVAEFRCRGCAECGADDLEQLGFGPFGRREATAGAPLDTVAEARPLQIRADAERKIA